MQRNTGYFPTESLEPCGNRLFSRSALNEGYLFRGSLKALQTQTDQLKNGKLRLYEKYTSGSISKAEYLKQKTAFDEKLAENAEAIQKAHERMQELDSECSCSDERVNQVCEQYRNQTALTFELTHAFIKAIYVHDADNIEILWKFRDIYEETEGKK